MSALWVRKSFKCNYDLFGLITAVIIIISASIRLMRVLGNIIPFSALIFGAWVGVVVKALRY